jgi:hypothetical protein
MQASIFVSASFSKHYDGLMRKIKEFENAGFTVLSPKNIVMASPADFKLLRGEYDSRRVRNIQKSVFDEIPYGILQSDALFIYNPGGRIEPDVAAQIGIALGYGKSIFTEEKCNDTIGIYCRIATVEEVRSLIPYKTIPESSITDTLLLGAISDVKLLDQIDPDLKLPRIKVE